MWIILAFLILPCTFASSLFYSLDPSISFSKSIQESLIQQNALLQLNQLSRRADIFSVPADSMPPSPQNFDLAAWNRDVETACIKAMTMLNGKASNPSGLAGCYNIPVMDKSTGTFQPELRIYNISPPTQEWQNVPLSAINVVMKYANVSIQVTDRLTSPSSVSKKLNKRSVNYYERNLLNYSLLERSYPTHSTYHNLVTRDVSAAQFPTQIRVLTYSAEVNPAARALAATDDGQMVKLLTPEIELTAAMPKSNEKVVAQLSTKDASFVTGNFLSPLASSSLLRTARATPPPTDEPFVLPGTRIEIFPIGLIVTGIWAFLFITIISLGTLKRIQFREQYRRRIGQAMAAGPSRNNSVLKGAASKPAARPI